MPFIKCFILISYLWLFTNCDSTRGNIQNKQSVDTTKSHQNKRPKNRYRRIKMTFPGYSVEIPTKRLFHRRNDSLLLCDAPKAEKEGGKGQEGQATGCP